MAGGGGVGKVGRVGGVDGVAAELEEASAVAPSGTVPEAGVAAAEEEVEEDLQLMTWLGLVVSELLRALMIRPASSIERLWLTEVEVVMVEEPSWSWSRTGPTFGIGEGSLGFLTEVESTGA